MRSKTLIGLELIVAICLASNFGCKGDNGKDGEPAFFVTITNVEKNQAGTGASISFECNSPQCSLECKLDESDFSACTSPKVYSALKPGAHVFQARAKVDDKTSVVSAYTWNTRSYKVKNIILFVGDGMQLASEISASRYLFGNDQGLAWHSFDKKSYVATWDVTTYNRFAAAEARAPYNRNYIDPYLGYNPELGGSKPYPLESPASEHEYFMTKLPGDTGASSAAYPATDSASSATALATGYKTDDGNISWLPYDPPTGDLRTIAEDMRDYLGAKIGVLSTVPFDHATPASFVSHNVNRDNFYKSSNKMVSIAEEIITKTIPDVVIAGGHPMLDNPDFDTGKGYISADLYNQLKSSSDFNFVERVAQIDGNTSLATAAENSASTNTKLFALFGGAGGNFESPVPLNSPGSPNVARGSIENPTMAVSVKSALKVLSNKGASGKGFFLMAEQGDIDWSNHANDFARMIGCVYDLNEAVKAAIDFIDQPGDQLDWSNTLLLVTADHANGYLRFKSDTALGAGVLPAQIADGSSLTYPNKEISYGSGKHTNELVMLYGKGDAAELINELKGTIYPGTEIIDNTQIHELMKMAAGL